VATSSPPDVSTGIAATATSASSGQITPSADDDLAVGFIAGHSNFQVITPTGTGYTELVQKTPTGPSTATVVSGYQDLGAPTAQSFTGGFGKAMYWASGTALGKPAD
jgi:hypothetical protein